MVNPIVWLLLNVISLFSMILIVWVIMSVLISFGVLNRHQPLVNKIFTALEQLIEPVLRPIRERLPMTGGFDFAPVVLILLLKFIEYSIMYFYRGGSATVVM